MKRFLSLLFFILGPPLSAASPPNFLLIFTDNHGYSDLGFSASKVTASPRMDLMAARQTKQMAPCASISPRRIRRPLRLPNENFKRIG
jgi:hypothetical protein